MEYYPIKTGITTRKYTSDRQARDYDYDKL